LLVLTPVSESIGATVTGLDLRVDQAADVRDTLNRALHEHGVLFVDCGDDLTDEDQKRFAAMFGTVHEYPFKAHDGDPFVLTLDSEVTPGGEATGDAAYGTDRWHTDGTVMDVPPQAGVLRPIVLPTRGGDTLYASMYAAYESLSSRFQRLLDGLEAVHTTESVYRARPAARAANIFGAATTAVHPVVVTDPITKRKLLYVNSNYTERIMGLSDAESDAVLRMLFDHVNTPEFHVRLRWDMKTMVIWENRVTQHRAVNDYRGRRVLRRVTVDGVLLAS